MRRALKKYMVFGLYSTKLHIRLYWPSIFIFLWPKRSMHKIAVAWRLRPCKCQTLLRAELTTTQSKRMQWALNSTLSSNYEKMNCKETKFCLGVAVHWDENAMNSCKDFWKNLESWRREKKARCKKCVAKCKKNVKLTSEVKWRET